MATNLKYTTPGLDEKDAERVVELLQDRLYAANDLHLTLKHVHWNVVGPHFIAVHEMLDPQVEEVRGFADDLAERIHRSWEEYSIGRATTQEHLGALDLVYQGVITSYREAIKELGELDPVTEDMFIGQTDKLELFHWFIRAHLEDKSGALATDGATSEQQAAKAAG